jgi:hypothetical protein
MHKQTVVLQEEDLQEVFALFSSPTDDELRQIYDESSHYFYKLEELRGEYTLTQEKREFAEDAWRAVTYFLHRNGFALVKEGREYDLGESSGYTVG